jgi:hypothetical protein
MLVLRRLKRQTEVPMRFTGPLTHAVVLAAMSPLAMAQASSPEQDHAAHHPPGASAPLSTPKAPAKPPPNAASSDNTMKSMQEMHAKMMAAKTAEERQALMAEHMKAMQHGIGMMGQMKGEKGGRSPEAMAKRMDMMELMMQMMVDREAVRIPAAK